MSGFKLGSKIYTLASRCAFTASFIVIALGYAAAPVSGFNLGKVFKAVGQTVAAPITVPAQTMMQAVQVIGGAPPSSILNPAQNAANNAAQVVAIAALPQKDIYQRVEQLAGKAGPGGEFIFDVATFARQLEIEMQITNAQTAANLLQGKNLLEIVSIPLAAAIRQGRERHQANAQPIPNDVKVGLSAFFDAATLARAKYAVGKVEITLPNGIGQVEKFGDTNFAVVVDDIIVFNVAPPPFADSPFWWGHEVTHVKQYTDLGIDEFARKYVFSGGADLENPANAQGQLVQTQTVQNGQASVVGAAVSIPPNIVAHAMYAPPIGGPAPPIQPPPAADPAVVQCFFSNNPWGYNFYGTQAGRIVVVDPSSGQWMHIGFATPPRVPGSAWTYMVQNGFYDVLPTGQIMTLTPYGPFQVGYAAKLQ